MICGGIVAYDFFGRHFERDIERTSDRNM